MEITAISLVLTQTSAGPRLSEPCGWRQTRIDQKAGWSNNWGGVKRPETSSFQWLLFKGRLHRDVHCNNLGMYPAHEAYPQLFALYE